MSGLKASGALVVCLTAWSLIGGFARAVPADAISSVPRIRLPGAPIPANGAIVFESLDSVEPVVQVLAEDGSVVVGQNAREVGALRFGGLIFAWVPDEPFEPGTYSVTTMHPWDSSIATIQDIEVILAIDGAAPALMSAPSASEVSTGGASVCCSDPITMDLNPCTVTEQNSVIHVEGGLSSSVPLSTLNQFLFRYKAALHSGPSLATARFMPIDQLPPVIFEAEADEYCFVLSSLSVATGEEYAYEDLPSCTPRGDLHVGPEQFDPDPHVLDPQLCPFPPPVLRSAWCEENEVACAGEPAPGCDQYEHVCNNGPLPERWVEAGVADRVNLASDTVEMGGSGGSSCSAHAPGRPRSSDSTASIALMALLWIARARRSKRVARLH